MVEEERGVEFTPLVVQEDNVEKKEQEKPGKSHRSAELDAMRGIIIIFMALDHASAMSGYRIAGEFWNNNEPGIQKENWTQISYFVTRFVTHLAQTGFFLLMGFGIAHYWNSRTKLDVPESRIVRHFAIRGAVLYALDFVLDLALLLMWIFGDRGAPPAMFGVLQALGFSMIVCSLLLWLAGYVAKHLHWRPISSFLGKEIVTFLLACASILITVITNFIIHGLNPSASNHNFLVAYLFSGGKVANWMSVLDPVIPWVPVCLIGMIFGGLQIQLREREGRVYKIFLFSGIGMWCLFVVLRLSGLARISDFGNFRLPQYSNGVEYANAFFTLSKYPPSLAYICLFLGATLIILYILHISKFVQYPLLSQPALVYGRSSLFFYVVHMILYMILGIIFQRNKHDLDALWVYPIWVTGLVIMYPLCVKYGEFKGKTDPSSLWRLF